jgi:serine/threonine protein kinase
VIGARSTACSLAEAHDAALVHRDVEPANLFVGGDRRGALPALDVASAGRRPQDPCRRVGNARFGVP